MRVLVAFAPLCLILVLSWALPSLAWGHVTITPIEDPTSLPVGPGGPPGICIIGNESPAAWAVDGLISPPETYITKVFPLPQCEDAIAGSGFLITTMHLILRTTDACDITLAPGLGDFSFLWCLSSPYAVSIPSAGLYDVAVPLNCNAYDDWLGGNEPCALLERRWKYFLGFEIQDASCADGSMPQLVTNDDPRRRASYHGEGPWPEAWFLDSFVDLFLEVPDWRGAPLFYAEIVECDNPIATQSQSWGAVKSLFD